MKKLARSVVLALFGLVVVAAAGAEDAINRGQDGLAVQGYDTVAYFTEGEPVLGSSEHEVEMHGVRWRFSGAGNKERFLADPEAYMPRYGGFCSGAMSRGFKATIDPEAFAIIDGKLYLAYNQAGMGRFEADTESNVAAADENWKTLRKTN